MFKLQSFKVDELKMNATKKVRCTSLQKKKLVEYMSGHPLFANGEFGGPLGAQRHESEWQNLATELREFGPEKSVAAWKITWRDLKRKARGDNAAFQRAAVTTGNNSEIPPVGESEQMVLSIIGTDSSIGVGLPESSIGEVITPEPVPESPTNSPPGPSTLPPPRAAPASLPPPRAAPASLPPPRAAPGPQRRRRFRPARSTSRFEQLQVEQNECLKSILEELRRANELRREHNVILLQNQLEDTQMLDEEEEERT